MKTRIMTHMVALYPDKEKSLETARALIDGGSSMIEVQFPFSDPTADGTLIQRACKIALKNGFTTAEGFQLIEKIRKLTAIPVFVMSYANIVFTRGIDAFLGALSDSGAGGIIVPDLPPDYDEGLYETGYKKGLCVVPVTTTTMKTARLESILKTAPEYTYVALRKGITGQLTRIDEHTISFLEKVSKGGTKILAGFGISERKQVENLFPHVYAAVVGSALIKEIQKNGEDRSPYRSVFGKVKELTGKDT